MKPPDSKSESGDLVPKIEEAGEVPQSPASIRDAIRRAQALVRLYVPEGRNLSEELIRERKGEVDS